MSACVSSEKSTPVSRIAPTMATPMPTHVRVGTWCPRARASRATQIGWVQTMAVADATDVKRRLGTQVAK